jgi:hypothetical protein
VLSDVGRTLAPIDLAPVERIEVIPVVEDIDAEFLGLGRGSTDIGVLGVLWMDLDGYSYWVHGVLHFTGV